ncbi:c-type heme family protein [Nitrospira sp. Kam-Ns4a]
MSAVHHWRIRSKLLLSITPLIVVMTGVAAYALHLRNAADLERLLTKRAEAISLQILADRQYYASVIVPRLLEIGGTVDVDYQRAHGRFPLPATFLREVSEYTAAHKGGFQANLISQWPINPDKGVTDQFEREAFAYLSSFPNGKFYRIEKIQSKTVMRFMTADRAVAQSCVDCHNAHPRSPKHDFKLNDVMGGLEIAIPVDEYIEQARRELLATVSGGVVFLVLFIGIVDWATRRTVTRPLSNLVTRMETRLKIRDDHSGLDLSDAPGNEMERFEEAFKRVEEILAAQQAQLKKQQGELQVANLRLEQQLWDNAKALQDSERRFRYILDLIPEPLIYVNPRGVIQAVNRRAEDISGRMTMDLVSLPLATILSPESAAYVTELFEAIARGEGPPYEVTLDVLRPTGGVARLAISFAALKDDEATLGYLLVARETASRAR